MSADPPDEPLPARSPGAVRRYAARVAPWVVALLLSLFVIHTYVRVYDPEFGWTKIIFFGPFFEARALPRLQRTPHYVAPDSAEPYGYDGQFYAEMALDPSLQDPAFDHALDTPTYRSRRIGLPALAFCLGGGTPERVLQAYALSNLLFWFVLLGALCRLLRPCTWQPLLCLSAAVLGFGAIASMEKSLVDLPAAALIFAGAAAGSWGGYVLLAAALLTRETSLLAAFGLVKPGRTGQEGGWRRSLAMLILAVVPLVIWILYVNGRFGHVDRTVGSGNFTFPLQAMCAAFVEGMRRCVHIGFGHIFRKPWLFRWLYRDHDLHELWTILSLFCQGTYFLRRRDTRAAFWRMGVAYLALGVFLGPAVWENSGAAARVLLPMTVCFYLRLAGERAAWFWPFFLLGSLSLPFGVHEFWTWS